MNKLLTLTSLALALATMMTTGCARELDGEVRLVEVRRELAYLCLVTDAISDSDPPSCAVPPGDPDNPRLVGERVPDLISDLGGRNGFATVTAHESGDRFILEDYQIEP
jgi:hypothetical protein